MTDTPDASPSELRPHDSDEIRVLHVDDDPDIGALTATYLERERDSLAVESATTAAAALERLEVDEFDCIVSDYDMPETNGLELLRTVRTSHPNLPFVLFTGKGSEEIASEAISAGVTDYLQKEAGTDQYAVLANRIVNATAHAWAERALRESEERYRTVVEGTHDAVYIYQHERFRFVNRRACEISGYSESELTDASIWDIVHPDDREKVQAIGRGRVLGEEVPSTYEAKIVRKDGDVRRCEFSVKLITYEGDPAVLGSVRDITEQRRAEERYRMFVEHSTDIVSVLDENGVVLYESPSVERVLGYDPEELVGDVAFEHIHPEDQMEAFEKFSTVIASDEFREERAELRFRHADGSWLWLEVVGSNRSGSVSEGYVLNSRPISTRKEREKSLQKHRRKIEALHSVAADIEACETEDAICELALSAAEEILEFDLCAINKATDGRLPIVALSTDVPPEGAADGDRIEDAGLAGKTYLTGESFVLADVRGDPDASPQGPYRAIISVAIADWGTFQTVSEEVDSFDETDLELVELLVAHVSAALDRVERERELRTRERELRRQNERLDRFASVLSHDLRNPLNVAMGRLDLFREAGDASDLDVVDRSLDRIEQIIEDVLTLTRHGDSVTDWETVELDAVARRAWESVETGSAALRVDTAATVRADAVRLQRALENLFRNAVEHGVRDVEDGPESSASSASSLANESNLTVTVGDCPDGFFVADDGRGIDAPDDVSVFGRDYSSKRTGGFGLSIVDTVAQSHGWRVQLVDADGVGTRFEFTGVDRS